MGPNIGPHPFLVSTPKCERQFDIFNPRQREPTMTTQRFSGMVAVITGAHQGIGRGVAERLGAEGAHVVCLDLKDCDETVAAIMEAGGTTESVRCRTCDQASWNSARHRGNGRIPVLTRGRLHHRHDLPGRRWLVDCLKCEPPTGEKRKEKRETTSRLPLCRKLRCQCSS